MANDMARLAIELEESRQVSSKHSSIAQRTAIEQHSNRTAQHQHRTAAASHSAQPSHSTAIAQRIAIAQHSKAHTPSLCPPKTVGEAHA